MCVTAPLLCSEFGGGDPLSHKRGEMLLPKGNSSPHFGHIVMEIVDFGHVADEVSGPVGDRPELVIEQTFDDVRWYIQFRQCRCEFLADRVERPTRNAAPFDECSF